MFFRNEIPKIEKIIHLDRARLSVYPKGDNHIELVDGNGKVLYSQSFLVEFLDGDPPQPVDSKTVIFVLPSVGGATEVVVKTSNGQVKYDIPSK